MTGIGTLGLDLFGVEHTRLELALFAVGWVVGWLLLWRPRPVPSASASVAVQRVPVAVVIPARNEATALPHLLGPLLAQRRPHDEIVVVDDHSDDDTGDVARAMGADVVEPPALPGGWLGKPHACWHGAMTTAAPTLVFLDADVVPGPSLLDDVAAESARHPTSVVSMQPWHRMETVGEQASILCNVTALMGCGAFTVAGPRFGATVAFGPVVALDRTTYERVGGHAGPDVRGELTEDIALARAVGSSRLFVGQRPERMGTTFRMYPHGLRELIAGWGRSIATGALSSPWWIAVATVAWVWSLAGGWLAAPIVYPLSAVQVWILGRRAGTTHPVAALFFPLLVVAFLAVFVRSLYAVIFRRDIRWKDRQVGTRAG